MNNRLKNIINLLIILCSISLWSQEQSFYIRSLRSYSLNNDSLRLMPIRFEKSDIVYDKIGAFNDLKNITIPQSGKYEINGYVNINPGAIGNLKDIIAIKVYWYKNYQKTDQLLLYETMHTYTFGNHDVARSFLMPPLLFELQNTDEISILVELLPESTITINKNKNYHHLIKPTGMQQMAALRIHRVE